jgi:hypothetical protein
VALGRHRGIPPRIEQAGWQVVSFLLVATASAAPSSFADRCRSAALRALAADLLGGKQRPPERQRHDADRRQNDSLHAITGLNVIRYLVGSSLMVSERVTDVRQY